MDLLQVALIFLILLLSIFLAITGFQVFFILKDLHKTLRRVDRVLKTSENIAEDIEKPVKAASDFVVGGGKVAASFAKAITGVVKNTPKLSRPKNKRFYKKVL